MSDATSTTRLSLCGLPVPKRMLGDDLSGVVLDTTHRGPDSAFFQILVPFAGDGTPHPWRGVRTDRSVYARTEAGAWALYDLADDPYERATLTS